MGPIWESIFATDISGDHGPSVHYWVLFVPPHAVNFVWYLIHFFTIKNRLGYRSAISAGPMRYGAFKGYSTIILDTPQDRILTVLSALESIGLGDFIDSRRARVKYSERNRYSFQDNDDDFDDY